MSVLRLGKAGVDVSGRPILSDVDLTVTAGEVVAILGENGSGKSTLVRSALGLRPLTRGTRDLFDTPVRDFRRWSRVGYVPQRTQTGGGVPASVQEVVASGRLSHRRPFLPASRADRTATRHALETVGLAERARDTMSTLSGGQQQRVLIARALAAEPDLFVLDEPNAGVDLGSQEAVAQTLAALVERGATLVVVLHELGPLASLIDRTVVLREGRVRYDGPPDPRDSAARHDHHRPADRLPPHVWAPFDRPGEA